MATKLKGKLLFELAWKRSKLEALKCDKGDVDFRCWKEKSNAKDSETLEWIILASCGIPVVKVKAHISLGMWKQFFLMHVGRWQFCKLGFFLLF